MLAATTGEGVLPFILIQGTFHLVGRTQAGNPTGFEPDGDSIQFKPTNPQLLNQLDQPGRPYRLTAIGSMQLRFEGIDALELHFDGLAHCTHPLLISGCPVPLGWKTRTCTVWLLNGASKIFTCPPGTLKLRTKLFAFAAICSIRLTLSA